MNLYQLEKLKNNPHYKLSLKQKTKLNQIQRKPMVEFGALDIHDNSLKKHNTNQSKKKVKNKKLYAK